MDGVEAIEAHPFFTGVDFSTIWVVEPPPIATGLVQPRVEQVGQFVMPEGFDAFEEDPANERGREGEEAESVDSEPRVDFPMLGALRIAPPNGQVTANGPAGVVVTPAPEPITKW